MSETNSPANQQSETAVQPEEINEAYFEGATLEDLLSVKAGAEGNLAKKIQVDMSTKVLAVVTKLIADKTPPPGPTTKFYHVVNCARAIAAGALSIIFHPYEHTSTWLGVYATDKPDEHAELDKLVEAKKLTAITEAEYNAAIKKKVQATQGFSQSLAASRPMPGIQASPAVPSVGNPVDPNLAAQPAENAAPLADVNEAVTPVPVERGNRGKK